MPVKCASWPRYYMIFGLDVVAPDRAGRGLRRRDRPDVYRKRHSESAPCGADLRLPAIADDSGLAVDFLGGAPGIYSARYSGVDATDQQNTEKLLVALNDVPDEQRTAQFHCVLVYMRHAEDPTPIVCHGSWPGVITREAAGNGGFGYDPISLSRPRAKPLRNSPAKRKARSPTVDAP